MKFPRIMILLAALAVSSAQASTITFNSPSNTYYVGVEDLTNGDYDYNDLIFRITSDKTLTLDAGYGAGFEQSAQPTLYPPLTSASNNGTPFWNHTSWDSAYANFGECLYDNGAHNTCTGSALASGAQYLAGSGNSQGPVDFFFSPSPNATITINLLANLTGNGNDKTDLYYCPEGSTFGCHQIDLGSSSTATFTSSQAFDLVLFQRDTMYDSNTSVHGNDDPGIDHFAVAVATPEPATFALVSGALLGLGAFRLRRRY